MTDVIMGETSEPQPVPAGQIVLPQSPAEHGVASPGFLVGGLNMA